MVSALILTADPAASVALEELMQSNGIRSRIVAQALSAREWISMQNFDLVFLDSRFPETVLLALIDHAWKHNSRAVCSIFHLGGKVDFEWSARLRGARVFSGTDALSQIGELLASFPSSLGHSQRNILLVEDLDAPREILQSYIQLIGYPHVDTARSVDAAVEMLHRAPEGYFCILTDLHMPERSGLDLLNDVRTEESLHWIPVIVITAYPTTDNLIDCLKAGASGFLAKPPTKKALRAELEKAERTVATNQSPRLCQPEDAHLLEEALQGLFV